MEPRVLLLDEPTQGVDVGAKASIYRHVSDLAERGAAVLVASSDAAELVHLCDRVLVLRSGTVATELRGARLTEERLIAETLGRTSHRRNMLVKREPVRAVVIRDDADVMHNGDRPLAAGEPPAAQTPPAPTWRASIRGAVRRLWRRP
jgi:ABC-type multidrug transport system ATPase subunit